MTDIEKLKELEAKATRGRWKVFATEREFVGGHTRQVYQIRTEELHPQSKDHYPVVCECKQNLKDGQKHGIWLSEEDAEFIVAAKNALPALLASIASKDEEIELLRDAEARWIGRLSVVRETTGDAGKMMLSEFSTWFEKRWNELLAAETSLASKDAEIAELRDLADNAIEQIAVIRKGFEYEAQQKLLSLNNELHARAEAAESSLTTALAALGEAREALEPFAKRADAMAQRETGVIPNNNDWAGCSVGDLRKARATLAKLNAIERNEDG